MPGVTGCGSTFLFLLRHGVPVRVGGSVYSYLYPQDSTDEDMGKSLSVLLASITVMFDSNNSKSFPEFTVRISRTGIRFL